MRLCCGIQRLPEACGGELSLLWDPGHSKSFLVQGLLEAYGGQLPLLWDPRPSGSFWWELQRDSWLSWLASK